MKLRVLSLILAIILGLCSAPVQATGFEPNATENPSQAVALLQGLGVISAYNPNEILTRGSFSAMVKPLNISTDRYYSATTYSTKIKYREIAAVFVDALGYGMQISDTTDANAYVLLASKIGLSKQISLTSESRVTMGEAVIVVYNALQIPKIEIESIRQDGTKVKTDKITLLDTMNIESVRGVVQPVVKKSGYVFKEKGSLIINGEIYDYSGQDMSQFVGMYVTAYIYNDDGDKSILALHVNTAHNTVKTIPAQGLVKDKTNEKQITATDDKDYTYAIAEFPTVIYNGMLLQYPNAEDFKITEGNIRLIDNDGDEKYDYVIIYQYESTVIRRIPEKSDVIEGKNNKLYDIADLKAGKLGVVNTPEGGRQTVDQLKAGDTVSVAIDKATNAVTSIVKGQASISGEITTITSYDECTIVEIDGEEYPFSASFKSGLSGYDKTALSVGKGATLFLNMYSEIVGYKITADSAKYGFVVAIDGGKQLKTAQIKLFTQEGEMKTFDLATSVRVNDIRTVSSQITLNTDLCTNGIVRRQLVKYQANDDNEINIITTATLSDEYGSYSNSEFTRNFVGSLNYLINDMNGFGGLYKLSDTTVVISVPYNKDDYDAYELLSKSSLYNMSYNLEIFNTDENYTAGVVVVYEKDKSNRTASLGNNAPVLVTSVSMRLDDDNLEVYVIKGYRGGAAVELLMKSNDIAASSIPNEVRAAYGYELANGTDNSKKIYVKDLKPGAIIQRAVDSKARVEAFTVFYNGWDFVGFEIEKSGVLKEQLTEFENGMLMGKVVSKTTSGFILNKEGMNGKKAFNRNIIYKSNVIYYLYDSKTKSVISCTQAEINSGDVVAVYYTGGLLKSVFIMR